MYWFTEVTRSSQTDPGAAQLTLSPTPLQSLTGFIHLFSCQNTNVVLTDELQNSIKRHRHLKSYWESNEKLRFIVKMN